MSWRLAHSLEKLRLQVNVAHPRRSKNSDGSIGDESHATRSSDHNPWVKDGGQGVVTAIDITHDPAGGFDSHAFADMLLKNKDSRIKYVISRGRISSGSGEALSWVWRTYKGSNPHNHHTHISVKSDKPHYDDTSDWKISGVAPLQQVTVNSYVPPPPTLRKGDEGDMVKRLQTLLGFQGTGIDGDFGAKTRMAVITYQNAAGLKVDGVVGPMTWAKLDPPRKQIKKKSKKKSKKKLTKKSKTAKRKSR